MASVPRSEAETNDAQRGRVFASLDLLWPFGRLLSILVGGIVAEAFGVRAVYDADGALLVIAAVVGWLGPPGIELGRGSGRAVATLVVTRQRRAPLRSTTTKPC